MKQLATKWSEGFDKNHVLLEYPRPAMRRESYINLNGVWKYAITKSKEKPECYDGDIVVPFSPEAPLSGVKRQLKPKEYLWYYRELPVDGRPRDGGRWLLHFGAVDQYAVVIINGHTAARHLGGYLPFTVDVTDLLVDGVNELTVIVQDYSDRSYYSRGKQKLKRGGMFYTAQSGIWQTVWMEQVPENHILFVKQTPLYDEQMIRIHVMSKETAPVEIEISSTEMLPVQAHGMSGENIDIPVPDMHSWSPEDPFLYDVSVKMGEDCVKSYFAMRKISSEKDESGIPRFFLNNRPYFQKGVLDQGYWPDGLYTPPGDEAMVYDIQTMKGLGFNMLRKHIKIEPQRWYYHCDRLGMLVWQDMVCGGRDYKSWYVTYMATIMEGLKIRPGDHMYGLLGRKDEKGRHQFIKEMRQTIHCLYNHPSIVTWVIFNEGWGQFHAAEVTDIAGKADNTRLIDQASGWFDQCGGDIRSIHNYFFPLKINPERRVTALTECGGYSWGVKGHKMFEKVYGYRIYYNRKELSRGYKRLVEKEILPNIRRGLSAVVYTQLSDVEEEVNGFLTYDRKVMKAEEDVVREANEKMTL